MAEVARIHGDSITADTYTVSRHFFFALIFMGTLNFLIYSQVQIP
jgi:hypothetical protein